MNLEFFNKAGNLDFDNLLQRDVTLLDNFNLFSGGFVSVKSSEKIDFIIKSNPSSGLYQITYPETPAALILTNIHGQEVLNITPRAYTHDLDISDLPDGNYAITLIYPEGASTSIIVKVAR